MEARRRELETLFQLHRPRRRPVLDRARVRARTRDRARSLGALAKLLVVLSCTILVALLSGYNLVNYDGGGGVIPYALFHSRRQFFYALLLLLVVTFYATVIGALFSPSLPHLAEAFYALALVSALLAFIILAWVFLPYTLYLAPWCFFLLSLLALIAVAVNECCRR